MDGAGPQALVLTGCGGSRKGGRDSTPSSIAESSECPKGPPRLPLSQAAPAQLCGTGHCALRSLAQLPASASPGRGGPACGNVSVVALGVWVTIGRTWARSRAWKLPFCVVAPSGKIKVVQAGRKALALRGSYWTSECRFRTLRGREGGAAAVVTRRHPLPFAFPLQTSWP